MGPYRKFQIELRHLFSRTTSLREAAATVFALVSILPFLVFIFYLWRSRVIMDMAAQFGLLLALVIAILGFALFRQLIDRISTLAQAVADEDPALAGELATAPVRGLGRVAEIDRVAETFGRLVEKVRVSTEHFEHVVDKLDKLSEMADLAIKVPRMQDLLNLVMDRTVPPAMGEERTLVVDDKPEFCEFLKEFLERKGYAVITALSGTEALRAVQAQRPRLILLDILMPGMDGWETMQRIQEIDRAARIIVITGVTTEEIAQYALRRGAYDCIPKPLDLSYLELSITTCLAHTGPLLLGHADDRLATGHEWPWAH